ncbi:hypothetical protein LAG90_06905 [Marinilongibacter aquaticus]|uniref:DUF6973 domain-containing protein n=1 Tax=Marinilongibacter aquaticus TaxID=2975157 RepID=UPI0021BDA5B3|nr:hypothetical protein [Marinilongibacter aquaticus]UBM60373.1 hypothetical protein LAG90_06905 [Marinilongibacter aquaticus]
MKKQICFYFLLSLSMLLSCNRQDVQPFENQSVQGQGFFKELRVNLTDGLTQGILNQTPEEFIIELWRTPIMTRGAGETGELGVSYETLIRFFENRRQNYPEFDLEKEEVKRFGILKNDFPDINTKREAIEMSGVILEFYEMRLRQDLKSALPDLRKVGSNERGVAAILELQANSMEVNYLAMHPIAGSCMKGGADDAIELTKKKFGSGVNQEANDKINAYKHTIWNMCSAGRMMNSGMPKSDAIGKTRDFATCHEMEYKGNSNGLKPSALPGALMVLHANWGLKMGNDTAMDLSNNAIGRSLIDDQAKLKLFGGYKNTDKNSIESTLASKVGSSSTYRKSNDIINVFHAGHWDDLASNRFGGVSTSLYIID